MKNEKAEILEAFMVAIVVIVVTFLIFAFVAIGISIKNNIEYGKKEGVVIDKNYTSAYTTMMSCGKSLMPQYHPESYSIKIQKEVEGKNKSIWIDIDQTTYQNIEIGEYYNGTE